MYIYSILSINSLSVFKSVLKNMIGLRQKLNVSQFRIFSFDRTDANRNLKVTNLIASEHR